jgi:NAD(P)-dependent dehydrogenase (short-subunit alcohol dehydrogenase family)
MLMTQKTVIVTGASQGIGAAVANLFLDRGYNVVGNSRTILLKTSYLARTSWPWSTAISLGLYGREDRC